MYIEIFLKPDDVNIDMFTDILLSAQGIIQKMLKTDELFYDDENPQEICISFDAEIEPEKEDIYIDFVKSLCRYSLKRKKMHRENYAAKTRNERAYTNNLFRRIGMDGAENRAQRKELISWLSGSTNIYTPRSRNRR